MATAPRPGAGRRAAADEVTLTVNLDGEAYVFRPNDTTAKMAGELRRECGMSVNKIMALAADDPDLDVIAAVVFLARRQRGEKVTYDEVASAITYGSELDTSSTTGDAIEPGEVFDSPEA